MEDPSQPSDRPLNSLESSSSAQADSLLFHIPQELRDLIFSFVFCSARLAFGRRQIAYVREVFIKPAPQILSLVYTCHRARSEIGTSWLRQILFLFHEPETMLNKLTALPRSTLAEIRHVYVANIPLDVDWTTGTNQTQHDPFSIASALKLLPGLNLDRLTVFGCHLSARSYKTLNTLIRETNGWKELRWVEYGSLMLAYAPFSHHLDDLEIKGQITRRPQPQDWLEALQRRDGATTGPSVQIFRSRQEAFSFPVPAPKIWPWGRWRGVQCQVLQPENREPFEQMLDDPGGLVADSYGFTLDEELLRPGEANKEILVVAKRGTGVDVVEVNKPPHLSLERDVRSWKPGKTWLEIEFEYKGEADDEDEYDDEGWDEDLYEDEYGHPGEYQWTPRYFGRRIARYYEEF